jgi:hypothetical protein
MHWHWQCMARMWLASSESVVVKFLVCTDEIVLFKFSFMFSEVPACVSPELAPGPVGLGLFLVQRSAPASVLLA